MIDLDIIGQIEKELDVELDQLDEIRWEREGITTYHRGFTLNQNGHVRGLT